jgi:tetratricopeptide (TPR) repeat protein
MTVVEAIEQGWQYHQAGLSQAAEERSRQVLQVAPSHPDAWCLLAAACQAQNRLDEAVKCYKEALRFAPNSAEVYSNLGVAYEAQGRLQEAIASHREALRLKPSLAAAYNNLGLALTAQGNLEEARTAFRDALRLQPNFALAHCNLGNVEQQQGKLSEAIACYRHALELQPDYADALNNLGAALNAENKLEQAETCLRRAVALSPGHADAHNNLGNLLRSQGRLAEAIACYRQCLRLCPDRAEAHSNLGAALTAQGKAEEATACLREAVRLRPSLADAHCNLGSLLQETGDLGAAKAAYREALQHDPRHIGARAQLVVLQQGQVSEDDFAILQELLSEPALADHVRSRLHFRAGQVHDAREEFGAAARHFETANALELAVRRQRGGSYDPAVHRRWVDEVIATFTPEFFARVQGWGLDSQRPIFVFGLPRSGTTLIEQILASHSKVHGAGELDLGQNAYASLPQAKLGGLQAFAALRHLDRDGIRRLAIECLRLLDAESASAARVVDKMPESYLHLGLLATLFPRARFIHCERDLRDVAVSCWITQFLSVDWSNDPNHLASRIREYRRLMEHWRRVLPVALVEVSYEAVVADLEGEARRLLDRCGLDWEPGCLSFHETRRPVRTASAVQVRQPIYARSVARWHNYAKTLAPLLEQL